MRCMAFAMCRMQQNPSVTYTLCVGCNKTGASHTLARRLRNPDSILLIFTVLRRDEVAVGDFPLLCFLPAKVLVMLRLCNDNSKRKLAI